MLYENTMTGAFGISFQAVRIANSNVSVPLNTPHIGKFKSYEATPPPVPKWNETVIEIKPVDGIQQWKIVPLPRAEIEQLTTDQGNSVRQQRTALLAKSDWTQLEDNQLSAELVNQWRAYRKNLRDIPKQSTFPWNITWPTAPTV